MLPDRSVLIGQKLARIAKIRKFKCDILSNFQTMCGGSNSDIKVGMLSGFTIRSISSFQILGTRLPFSILYFTAYPLCLLKTIGLILISIQIASQIFHNPHNPQNQICLHSAKFENICLLQSQTNCLPSL